MATTEGELWELSTRSEAVYLDAVTADASAGFIVRICRFPEAGLAWTWFHVFHHGHVHSYTHHELRCPPEAVAETESQVCYQAGEFRISRDGDRLSPEHVSLEASALLHSGPSSPHGEGALPCEIQAQFQRLHEGVESRSGRTEVLGLSTARITLGDADIKLEAMGQFHEQIQEEPRFNRPFSYGTLRGEDAGCIFIRGATGATGALVRNNSADDITAVRLAPPGVIRRLEIDTASGYTARGSAVATFEYEIPVFHTVRPGTLVTATIDGIPLSGCINDLLLGDLAFDHL